MAFGISGDSVVSIPTTAGSYSTENLILIELRVHSVLLQTLIGTMTQDQLSTLRNDQAFELGLPTPVIGN